MNHIDDNAHDFPPVSRIRILGVPVNVVSMAQAVAFVTGWARESSARTVFVRDTPALTIASRQPNYLHLHETADMVTPDGMPLVWVGRLRGLGKTIERVSGADLVDAVCAASLNTGQSHYFYGAASGVAEEMARRLCGKYPGLKVAGVFSPPMREVGPDTELADDMKDELDSIRMSGADFVWVGLSSPKQDYFIMQAAPYVGRSVFLAVGAAFDFHSGRIKRAPLWMQRHGLEWLHRLWSEPGRLSRRYLVLAPKFVWLVALETLGVRSR